MPLSGDRFYAPASFILFPAVPSIIIKTERRCQHETPHCDGCAAEVGLYEQISRLNNHRPFRLPLMRAVSLNFFGTLSVRYELLAPM